MKSSIIPKKSLGQNFLANPRILDKIVAAAEITEKDVVLEIGPGAGNLTEKLAEKAGEVIAVEKDRRLVGELKNKFKDKNIEIIESDVLKIKPEVKNYKIVGNIPYYITSNLLRTIFEKWPKPELIVLTIQKEVAQRIVAKPPKMNLLAVSVQFFSEPKIISYISKENFRPRPKVDSAIIKLIPRKKLPIKDIDGFFKIVRVGFSQKRKQIKNTIDINLLNKADIKPESRPEELTLEDWLKIL